MTDKLKSGSELNCLLPQKIVDRLVLAYKDRPLEVAKACDEVIDRSGNLLGWVREAAVDSK
jgi:hypothetical protein